MEGQGGGSSYQHTGLPYTVFDGVYTQLLSAGQSIVTFTPCNLGAELHVVTVTQPPVEHPR